MTRSLVARPRSLRLLLGARGAYALGLMGAPGWLAQTFAGQRSQRLEATIRVLGLRELLEVLALWFYPHPRCLLAGAAVDATHSGSMVTLAVFSPSLRVPSAASALVSGGLATLTAREALIQP